MWLRDRLPKDIPGSRISIWGYDTALLGSISVQRISDLISVKPCARFRPMVSMVSISS